MTKAFIKWHRLAIILIITFGAAILGSILTTPSIGSWYAELIKPAFNPPNWLFGPVWSLLFLLMSIAAWRVWQRGGQSPAVKTALTWYGWQLALNVSWSLCFFYWHSPYLALWVLLGLWLAIAITMAKFASQDKTAAWLLAPYLAWVSFAGILNYALWVLN